MEQHVAYRPTFESVFDVAVWGAGHAGFAAAVTLARQGLDVLVVDRLGDVLSESGRSFAAESGTADCGLWRELADRVGRLGGRADGWLDGALTEVVGTAMLHESGAASLYYVQAVAVERDDGGLLDAVVVATRAGLRRVVARRWVDATETGELLRLTSPRAVGRTPSSARLSLHLQHEDWRRLPAVAGLRPTAWPSERVLTRDVPPDGSWDMTVLAGLDRLEATLGDPIAEVCLSHLSLVPLLGYHGAVPDVERPPNLVPASPAFANATIETPADRHRLGLQAAAAVVQAPSAAAETASGRPVVPPAATRTADVCVVGVGTGGVLASIAAAREGSHVLALDGGEVLGGVGTAGGIHVYWFGTPGGLQSEVVERTRRHMNAYRRGPLGDGPYNPWAKLVAIAEMLRESQVDVVRNALLFDVERTGDRVTAACFATPDGVLRVEARGYVDATGDGDLCALAGVDFRLGRDSDGLLHAFSQSSGRLRTLRGRPRMDNVNFDAGFCDPTDVEDLTRARRDGVLTYLVPCAYDETERPTYIAPAIGIRQGRQVRTEVELVLDDLVSRRRFSDVVGYTTAHFDNHATDMEFESDEAVLYQWVLEQASTPVACEVSYRTLLPRGLVNVWIGSRCLGLSQDAQYVTRMQRDVQRVGEVAGLAAALGVRRGTPAGEVPLEELQARLRESAALGHVPRTLESTFGVYSRVGDDGRVQFRPEDATAADLLASLVHEPDRSDDLAMAAAALDRGVPDASLWWAYQNSERSRPLVLDRLRDAGSSAATTWLAAALLAVWGEPEAEPRLLEAIRTMQPPPPVRRHRPEPEGTEAGPGESTKLAPGWLVAVVLLRCCGTAAALDELERLLDRPAHALDTLAAVTITIRRLAERSGAEVSDRCRALVDKVADTDPLAVADYAARNVGLHAHTAATQGVAGPDHVTARRVEGSHALQLRRAYQDRRWQLDLVLADARRALGMQAVGVADYLHDPRGYVRSAFARRLTGTRAASPGRP